MIYCYAVTSLITGIPVVCCQIIGLGNVKKYFYVISIEVNVFFRKWYIEE